MKKRRKARSVLPVGTMFIYYNRWCKFSTQAFDYLFLYLTKNEIERLREGSTFYVNNTHLHSEGGVFGKVKVCVMEIEHVDSAGSKEICVHFTGGPIIDGRVTTINGTNFDLQKADDERYLAMLRKKIPESMGF